MALTARQWIFLSLAALGLLCTWYFNLQFFAARGSLDIAAFVESGMTDAATSSLTFDLLIAFATFVLWVPMEARRLGMRHAWAYVVLGGGIAFAFAFPLFLFMRDRRLAEETVV